LQQLYLCRHGETEWTLTGQHTGKTDLELTKKGESQGALLRKRLEEVTFEKVFTSPLKRAVQTCGRKDAIIEPLAVEYDYGDYEGLTTEEIHQKNSSWNLLEDGAPNGESPEQAGKRADQLLEKLTQYGGKIALFSHGHFLRILAARYLGLKPASGKLFQLNVASLSILGYEKQQPSIVLWNEIEHLRIKP